jgi:hypothetical protein
MNAFHLAQVNIGRVRAPVTEPLMKGFVDRLDEINALADRTPGFVWRLQTSEGNATYFRPFPEDDRILLNMSVWESLEALRQYVYRGPHAEVMRGRREWVRDLQRPLHGAVVGAGRPSAGHRRGQEAARARRGTRADAIRVHVQSAVSTRRSVYPRRRLVVVRAVSGGVSFES